MGALRHQVRANHPELLLVVTGAQSVAVRGPAQNLRQRRAQKLSLAEIVPDTIISVARVFR